MGSWGGKPNLINETEFWKLDKMADKKSHDSQAKEFFFAIEKIRKT